MAEYITEFFGSSSGGSYAERREPIVRCRDCKHFLADELGEVCGLFEFEMVDGEMADGFCKWGERRSE